MLPGGKSLARVVAWVKNYIGDELDWDARLVLKKEEIPKLRLGQVGQLGWTTWVHSKPMTRDADDLVLRPQATAVAA
jgi:type VI secretion system protein ImpH